MDFTNQWASEYDESQQWASQQQEDAGAFAPVADDSDVASVTGFRSGADGDLFEEETGRALDIDIDDVAFGSATFDGEDVWRSLDVDAFPSSDPFASSASGALWAGGDALAEDAFAPLDEVAHPHEHPHEHPADATGEADADAAEAAAAALMASCPATDAWAASRSAGVLVAPPLPPFVRRERRSSFECACAPASALDDVCRALARHACTWSANEDKCKLKCTAYSAHALLRFDVRIYSIVDGLLVEFQRKSGDGFAFAELYAAVTRDVECCPSKTACSRRASGLMGPRDAPSLSPPTASNWAAALEPSGDDAAAKEARSAHVDALCTCLESGLLETARGGARALAALAARDASLFADKPEVWMRVASIAGDNHADDDVRIAALSVVAHLAEARFGAGANGAAVAQAEADAFGRLIEPLLDTIEHAACEHVRGEAARALAPLSSAFPSTFAHLGARDVLTSAIRAAPEHAVVRQFAALALVHVR